jgi:DNA repair protein RecO (recombination protein O)
MRRGGVPVVDTTLGIVVGGIDYGDADRIVTFLTRDRGRLKGLARSAKKSRRRFGAALELFSKVRLRYVERPAADLVRLEGCDIVDLYPGIRTELSRLAAASYAAELGREAALDRDAFAPLFDLLDRFFSILAREPYDPGLVRAFELRVLRVLGWRPELGRCAVCGASLPEHDSVLFSIEQGGTLCGRCSVGRRGFSLSQGTLRTMRAVFDEERVTFTRMALRESDEPVGRFLEVQLGKRLRSREFLESVGA